MIKATKTGKCSCGCGQSIQLGSLLASEGLLFGARHERGGRSVYTGRARWNKASRLVQDEARRDEES